jgi:hypothetical protein
MLLVLLLPWIALAFEPNYQCPLCGERYIRQVNRDRCAAKCKSRALEIGRVIQLNRLKGTD